MKIYADELANVLGYNKHTVLQYFENYQLVKYIKGQLIDLNLQCQKDFMEYLHRRRNSYKNRMAIHRFKIWCNANKYKLDPMTEDLYNR